jgi:leader peptidase (prepilin peptidase)/N-methyltransferase
VLRYYFIVVASAVCGSIFGSFANVVIYRLPREGLSIIKPRYSFCPNCGKTIRWFDNIPIISYFLLAGKCRDCKGKISPRYLVVEALSAFLFAYSAHRFAVRGDWGEFAVAAALCEALIICAFIDADFRIIPDAIDIPGIMLAPIISFLVPSFVVSDFANVIHKLGFAYCPALPFSLADRAIAAGASVFGIVAAAVLIYAVGVVGKAVFKKEAMGFGDVKLMGMIGGFLGWQNAVVGFFLGCIVGAVVGVTLILAVRRRDPHIPFGPFLAIGAVAVLFHAKEILHFLLVAYPAWLSGR